MHRAPHTISDVLRYDVRAFVSHHCIWCLQHGPVACLALAHNTGCCLNLCSCLNCGNCSDDARSSISQQKGLPRLRLELRISASVERRLIHWANGAPVVTWSPLLILETGMHHIYLGSVDFLSRFLAGMRAVRQLVAHADGLLLRADPDAVPLLWQRRR